MKIAPDKSSIWGIMAVIIFTDLIVLLFFPFSRVPVAQTLFSIFGILGVDALLGIFMLHEYKTFDFKSDVLMIQYSFLKFLRAIKISSNDIEKIRIIRYSIQNRIAPVMIVSFSNPDAKFKDKKIRFRMEHKRIDFQDFIAMLRAEGIHVECEGDVWF